MIITVTLNPSLDRTIGVDRLTRGAVLRTGEPTLEPGGKGVNVSRALSANGIANVAVVPLGGPEGAELGRLLDLAGVHSHFVPVAARTRSNISIAEADGTVTKLNEPGFALSDKDVATLDRVLTAIVSPGDWVVLSGSVPPDFEPTHYRSLLESLTASGASLAIDTSGDALVASLAARPRLIKPNRDELAELVGGQVDSIADVVSAAGRVRERGVEYVLTSLGPDGAVLVGPTGVLVGESRVDSPRSTVGAGDCFLAGFLVKFARDETDLTGALREALAWGAAATSLPGTAVPAPTDIDYSRALVVSTPVAHRPLVTN